MTTANHQTDAAEGGPRRGSTALALGVFFLAGTFASAAGMHGCPEHHHIPSPDSVASGAGGAGAEAVAGSGRDGGAPVGPTCTCLGDCQSGAPTALHEPPVRAVPDAEPLARAGSADETELRPGPRPEYFLPYPLGPPAA
jgi:hypothetical protein